MDLYEKLKELAEWLNEHKEEIEEQELSISLVVDNNANQQRISFGAGDAFSLLDMSRSQEEKAIARITLAYSQLVDELNDIEYEDEGDMLLS